MRYRVVTPPTKEPVTAFELAEHLRLDWDTEQKKLQRLIVTARQWLENILGRAFITQQVEAILPLPIPPQGRLSGIIGPLRPYVRLPQAAPLLSVQTVEKEEQLEQWQSLTAGADWVGDDGYEPGRIWLSSTALATWPMSVLYFPGARPRLRMNYTVGYGPSADDVPAPICHAVLSAAAWMYEHREEIHRTDYDWFPSDYRIREL